MLAGCLDLSFHLQPGLILIDVCDTRKLVDHIASETSFSYKKVLTYQAWEASISPTMML